ncbi:hypothetical protein TRIUR3_24349 [Triticum urartu]|uniref:Uncharacterized protein n=1 Tax=Triticum urartu TaxID=4572 RepID=M7ZUM5_TRIUA|nr:hypothetical protein TRIUR3_24349 [Triticum urartu]
MANEGAGSAAAAGNRGGEGAEERRGALRQGGAGAPRQPPGTAEGRAPRSGGARCGKGLQPGSGG